MACSGCSGSCTDSCSGCSGGCSGCKGGCGGSCVGSCKNCGSGCSSCKGCNGCASCKGSCSGECKGCKGGCSGSCDGGCSSSCSGGCKGNCKGGCKGCDGCSSCSGTCKGNCTGTCTGCGGSCQGGCTSCTSCSSCTGTCTGCGNGCDGGCKSCSGSCVGSCKTTCNNGCTSANANSIIASLGANIDISKIIYENEIKTLQSYLDKERDRRGLSYDKNTNNINFVAYHNKLMTDVAKYDSKFKPTLKSQDIVIASNYKAARDIIKKLMQENIKANDPYPKNPIITGTNISKSFGFNNSSESKFWSEDKKGGLITTAAGSNYEYTVTNNKAAVTPVLTFDYASSRIADIRSLKFASMIPNNAFGEILCYLSDGSIFDWYYHANTSSQNYYPTNLKDGYAIYKENTTTSTNIVSNNGLIRYNGNGKKAIEVISSLKNDGSQQEYWITHNANGSFTLCRAFTGEVRQTLTTSYKNTSIITKIELRPVHDYANASSKTSAKFDWFRIDGYQ